MAARSTNTKAVGAAPGGPAQKLIKEHEDQRQKDETGQPDLEQTCAHGKDEGYEYQAIPPAEVRCEAVEHDQRQRVDDEGEARGHPPSVVAEHGHPNRTVKPVVEEAVDHVEVAQG